MTGEPENIGHHCRVCDVWKTRRNFYRDATTSSGFKTECKACQTARQRAQYRANENGYGDYHRAKAVARDADRKTANRREQGSGQ